MAPGVNAICSPNGFWAEASPGGATAAKGWAVVARTSVEPTRLIAVAADDGGEPREVLKLPSTLRLYDVSPDGDVLLWQGHPVR